jgi:hypothetical protein
MKTGILLIVLLFIFLSTELLPQGEAAILFLSFPVSPTLNSMGGAGSSLPTDDPYGFIHNPAQLGYFGMLHNAAVVFPNSVTLGDDPFRVNIRSLAVSAGFDFSEVSSIPLSVGIGYAQPEMTFGRMAVTSGNNIIGYFEPGDYYSTYSLGAGYRYSYFHINAGLSYKSITSEFSPSVRGDFSAWDFGLLLTTPLLKIIGRDISFNLWRNTTSVPFLNFSAGYSMRNVGGKIYYIDPAQSDPLPRLANLGYGISAGMISVINNYSINLLKLEFTSEAEDILIEQSIEKDYQSGLGDINIGRNIIGIKGDDKVLNRSGFRFDLFDTFSYRSGKFSGRFSNLQSTDGLEFRAKGMFVLLASAADIEFLNYIAQHIDVRYSYSNYKFFNHDTKRLSGISLVLSGYNLF